VVVALALFGLSSTTSWLLYPAAGVFLYTLASPFGFASIVLSWEFARTVMRGVGLVALLAVLFMSCVVMVNAPLPIVPALGGIAMLLLLTLTAFGTAAFAARRAMRSGPLLIDSLRRSRGLAREKIAWMRFLVALQFATVTRATTDR
jgi:hypothetical protein